MISYRETVWRFREIKIFTKSNDSLELGAIEKKYMKKNVYGSKSFVDINFDNRETIIKPNYRHLCKGGFVKCQTRKKTRRARPTAAPSRVGHFMNISSVRFLLEAFVVIDEDAPVAVVHGLRPVRLMLDLFAAVHVFVVVAWFSAAAFAR